MVERENGWGMGGRHGDEENRSGLNSKKAMRKRTFQRDLRYGITQTAKRGPVTKGRADKCEATGASSAAEKGNDKSLKRDRRWWCDRVAWGGGSALVLGGGIKDSERGVTSAGNKLAGCRGNKLVGFLSRGRVVVMVVMMVMIWRGVCLRAWGPRYSVLTCRSCSISRLGLGSGA